MIDLEKLVPLPETYYELDSAMGGKKRVYTLTSSQMAAFRQQVAQWAALRCWQICKLLNDPAVSAGDCADAIAAEFGLGDV